MGHNKFVEKPKQQMRARFKATQTWTGDAAVRSPATPPPKTRPSGPASNTLNPPVRLRWPPLSERRNEPESDRISNRP